MKKIYFSLFLSTTLNLCLGQKDEKAMPNTQQNNKVYPTGLAILSQEEYEKLPKATIPIKENIAAKATVLPSSYSLASFFPLPGNQGSIGSCVGWAVSYAKSYLERRESNNSFTAAFGASYIYNQIKITTCTQPCMCGSYITDALNILKNQLS